MTLSLPHQQRVSVNSPESIVLQAAPLSCRPVLTDFVGEVAHDDTAHERYIRDCGREIELAVAEWEQFGNAAARNEAHFWEGKQREAILARSPAQVAQMEVAKGLT